MQNERDEAHAAESEMDDAQRRLAEDYTAAKRALGNLWDTLTKETYSRFTSVADQAEKKFHDRREKVKETDVKEVLNKAGSKIEKLAKSASAEARRLALQAKLLYMMLRDTTSGKFKAPWVTVAAITACLLYVISPIDVLPDFIPGIGLIDDALVVALCISLVRIDLRRYADEMGLALEDYGL